ncbi:hypothetical protein BGZ76_004783, partial [Entomortierella beljakovae]
TDATDDSSSYYLPITTQPSKPIPPFNQNDTSYNSRASEKLGLVHVPLKVSCDILRQLYNSTGGTNWSNQDGWQYVDSVTIPTVPPYSRPNSKRDITHNDNHHYFSNSIKKRKHDDDRDDDFSAITSPNRPASHSITSGPTPHRGSGRGSSSGNGGGNSIIDDPLITTGDMDPDNCCDWYGVVCIGPDGIVPPPWPPRDDDLMMTMNSNHPQVKKKDLRTDVRYRYDLPHQSQEKRSVSDPHYNYNYHHHPKEGGDRKGGSGDNRKGTGGTRGTGGHDNRHSPDDGNNEGGNPSIDQQPDMYGNINTPIIPPSQVYGDQRGSGRRRVQVDDWYVIELHLGLNGLSGPVPEELGHLVNLMILDISNNDLTGRIPDSFSKLTRLRRL